MHDRVALDALRAFDSLFRTRHLTRSAREVGLSQPAMSRTLGRLRTTFADALFVRTPRGMTPTPRAEMLAPEVRDLLQRAERLTLPAEFEPSRLERTFVLSGPDFLEAGILPRLSALLSNEAPRVSVTSRPSLSDVGSELAAGRFDLVVGVRQTLPPDALAAHLFDDTFVCAVRAAHPRVGRTMSLARYLELSHVLISPRGEPGSVVDDVLVRMGKSRRVAVRTHSFLSAPLIVAESDLVLTGPRRVLEPMAPRYRLKLLAPPLSIRGFAVYAAWHPRVQDDPAHTWFRGLLKRAAAGETGSVPRGTTSGRRSRER